MPSFVLLQMDAAVQLSSLFEFRQRQAGENVFVFA